MIIEWNDHRIICVQTVVNIAEFNMGEEGEK